MWVFRLIIAALVVLLVEAYLTVKFGLYKVSLERSFDTIHAAFGQEIHLIEKISNNKILPVPCLKVESKIDRSLQFGRLKDLNILQDMYHVSLFCLMPYIRIIRTHNVKCNKRGYYHLTSASLTARSITGSVSLAGEVKTDALVYVFPRILKFQELKLPSHSWQGDMVVRRWILEDPFIRAGVREYTSSDPMKSINWKASARSGILQVNLYEPTAYHKLMILLNVDTSLDQWTVTSEPERVEYGISVAATIFEYAFKNTIESGFASNGFLKDSQKEYIHINPAAGTKQKLEIMECLARIVINRSITFNTLIDKELDRNPGNMDYLFITAVINEETENKISRLKAMGNAVEILKI